MIKYSKKGSSKLLGSLGQKISFIPQSDRWILQARVNPISHEGVTRRKISAFLCSFGQSQSSQNHRWLCDPIVVSWQQLMQHLPTMEIMGLLFLMCKILNQNPFFLTIVRVLGSQISPWNSKSENWVWCRICSANNASLRVWKWDVSVSGSWGQPEYIRQYRNMLVTQNVIPLYWLLKNHFFVVSFVTHLISIIPTP